MKWRAASPNSAGIWTVSDKEQAANERKKERNEEGEEKKKRCIKPIVRDAPSYSIRTDVGNRRKRAEHDSCVANTVSFDHLTLQRKPAQAPLPPSLVQQPNHSEVEKL